MRVNVQRVSSCKVSVGGKTCGEIGKGLFLLVGFTQGDDKDKVDSLCKKILKLRVISDEKDKMNLDILETNQEIMVVSQFTLYGNCDKGNRPSFVKALEPIKARELYEHMVKELKKTKLNIQTGQFGAYMDISVILDGPVTINLEV